MVQKVFGTFVQLSREDLEILVPGVLPTKWTSQIIIQGKPVWKLHQCIVELSNSVLFCFLILLFTFEETLYINETKINGYNATWRK